MTMMRIIVLLNNLKPSMTHLKHREEVEIIS